MTAKTQWFRGISFVLPVLGCASMGPTAAPARAKYADEVRSEAPLGYWRLAGDVPGAIANDEDGATAFSSAGAMPLDGADFGGPELSVELWVKNVAGEVLSYVAPSQKRAIRIRMAHRLEVELLGKRVEISAPPAADGAWRLLGVSWRSDTGLMIVGIDGKEAWRGEVAKGKLMPYDGRLSLRPTRGAVDEVAVFDRFHFASQWLRRWRVARGQAAARVPDRRLPLQLSVSAAHTDRVLALQWSPDGRVIASGGADGAIKLWDAATGAQLRTLEGQIEQVFALAWSPEGRTLASGSADGAVRLWDAATGALLATFSGHSGGAWSLSWSPDGSRLVVADMSGSASVWNADSKQRTRVLEGGTGLRIGVAKWSPRPDRLATADWTSAASNVVSIAVWDPTSGERLSSLETKQPWAAERRLILQWSPDGRHLASASWDESARRGCLDIWKVTEAQSRRLCGHAEIVNAIRWSPDGRQLASSAKDGAVKIWDAASGRLLRTLTGRSGESNTIEWSPNGLSLASTSRRGVWISRISDGRHLDAFQLGVYVSGLSWSPDGRNLAVSAGPKVSVLDPAGHGRVRELGTPSDPVVTAGWRPGERVIAASKGGGIVRWDAASGSAPEVSKVRDGVVRSVAWSPDGAWLASGHTNAEVVLWDAEGQARFTLDGGVEAVREVDWHPLGTQLVSISYDKLVRIWDPTTGRLSKSLRGHAGYIADVAWSPDGARLASADDQGEVKIWRTADGAALHHLKAGRFGTGYVSSVDWSPDGTQLAVGSVNSVEIWDAVLGERKHFSEHKLVDVVKWSPDGRQLASTESEDLSGLGRGLIRIWDPATYKTLHTFAGHGGAIRAVAWRPDSSAVASGGVDGTIRIHSAKTGALLRSLEGHTAAVISLQWRADGGALVSTSDDGTVRLWRGLERAPRSVSLVAGADFWLATTAEGYFMGTIDAPLFLVRGNEAFSIEQLAPIRNRPERVLTDLGASTAQVDVYAALRRRRLRRLGLTEEQVTADFASAPTVRLLSVGPPNAQGRVRVELVFTDRTGLESGQVFVNGVPIASTYLPLDGRRQRVTVTVQLTAGSNQIEATALNSAGIEALRASTTLEHDGRTLPRPRLYFVGFGVSDYADERINDLQFAHKDVKDLERTLRGAGARYGAVHTQTFINAEVSSKAIESARRFLDDMTEHDTLIMFIAGHGIRGTDATRTYYYLVHETRLDDLASTAVPFELIESLLYASKARKKLFLIDTCESGDDIDLAVGAALSNQGLTARQVRGIRRDRAPPTSTAPRSAEQRRSLLSALRDRSRLITQDLTRRSGAIVLASSLGAEPSYEGPAWSNGAFTKEILQALRTPIADANRDGEVDTDELRAHVVSAVPALTRDRQHPNVERDNPQQRFSLSIEQP